MNETIGAGRRRRSAMPPKSAPAAVGVGGRSGAPELGVLPAALPADALDDRVAIVGTVGSGKTHAAKGLVEWLLDIGARVAIVDPRGVWWELRASAAGYPVVVFGGKYADVPITAEMGPALGRMIASEALVCVVDLSELGSNAARRRFMAAFSEALLKAAGEVPPTPSTLAERLALWCDRLLSPAPEMLRTLAAQRERYMDAAELRRTQLDPTTTYHMKGCSRNVPKQCLYVDSTEGEA
jgi:hypothetical protein